MQLELINENPAPITKGAEIVGEVNSVKVNKPSKIDLIKNEKIKELKSKGWNERRILSWLRGWQCMDQK